MADPHVPPCWFQEFHPHSPYERAHVVRGRLPHWDLDGRTQFVTWTLAGALPRVEWKRLREHLATAPCNSWHDATRLARLARRLERAESASARALLDAKARDVVALHLVEFDGIFYRLDCFVIMPSHVHVLVTPAPGVRLQRVLNAWRAKSARDLMRQYGWRSPVWARECFDRLVRTWRELLSYREYIAANPRKAGLSVDAYTLWRANVT